MKGLSLRKIATAVGIQAPSIYEHFASKEVLLEHLRQRAINHLIHRFQAAKQQQESPKERLIAVGMAYVQYAREERETFVLFFLNFASNRKNLAQVEPQRSPYTILRHLVETYARPFIESGSPEVLDEITYGYWSLIHGAAMLQSTFLSDFEADFPSADRSNFERYLTGSVQFSV